MNSKKSNLLITLIILCHVRSKWCSFEESRHISRSKSIFEKYHLSEMIPVPSNSKLWSDCSASLPRSSISTAVIVKMKKPKKNFFLKVATNFFFRNMHAHYFLVTLMFCISSTIHRVWSQIQQLWLMLIAHHYCTTGTNHKMGIMIFVSRTAGPRVTLILR